MENNATTEILKLNEEILKLKLENQKLKNKKKKEEENYMNIPMDKWNFFTCCLNGNLDKAFEISSADKKFLIPSILLTTLFNKDIKLIKKQLLSLEKKSKKKYIYKIDEFSDTLKNELFFGKCFYVTLEGFFNYLFYASEKRMSLSYNGFFIKNKKNIERLKKNLY